MQTTHHGHGVQLLQARHGLEEKHHNTATLDSLNGTGEEVGRDGLVVLEHNHAKGLTKNLGRVLVVAAQCQDNSQVRVRVCCSRVADVGHGNEELKGVLLVGLANATLNVTLDLGLTLLAVSGKAKLLLVAPEDIGTGRDTGLREEEVEVDDLDLLAGPGRAIGSPGRVHGRRP